MLFELLNAVLELDDFDGAAEACSSSVGFQLREEVVVGGILAAQPDVVECFLAKGRVVLARLEHTWARVSLFPRRSDIPC